MKRNAKKMLSEDAFRTLRGASPQERLLHRLHSVVLVLSGLSASEAGRIFNDSPRAVAYWVKRFGKSGLDGLKDESRPGRPARLNEAQMATLQTFVRRRYAHSQAVGGAMLAAYIKQEFGIALTARQCWRILKRLSA